LERISFLQFSARVIGQVLFISSSKALIRRTPPCNIGNPNTMNDPKLLLLDPADNVPAAIQTLEAGDVLTVAGQCASEDMDVDAGRILEGRASLDEVGREILDLSLAVARGAQTKSVELGHQEFVLTYKSFEPIGPSCLPSA
jgi:hypothetical protein